jgi:SAM-dependent methyltransferase
MEPISLAGSRRSGGALERTILSWIEAMSGSSCWKFRCPECGRPAFAAADSLLCPYEGRTFPGVKGVLCLLRRDRLQELEPFLVAYQTIRSGEGWSGPADYYRRLPFDPGRRHRDRWKIRARSYRAALKAIEACSSNGHPLRILDLGAGNGWFSYRMSERGYSVLATDISIDEEDGLGAFARYATCPELLARVTRARADMEDLPLEDSQFDVVVANGSLHYARSVERAVLEARRVLRGGGLFLVLDSPVYPDSEAGRAMVRRRIEEHRERFAVSSAHDTAGFLVEDDFLALLDDARFKVSVHRPFEGLERGVRRGYHALKGIAPLARFLLFASEKTS